ncbi:MAG: LysM peptidoglycan-binding domain-containing protein [Thermodesulfobacteriota bacterium]
MATVTLKIKIQQAFGRTAVFPIMRKPYLSWHPTICTILLAVLVCFLLLSLSLSLPSRLRAEETEKDSFSISLVQEATVKKDNVSEVPYERYTVKEGEHIWQILREKGLITVPDITDLLNAIKNMNKSLKDLDLIHPGQTITIPLNIVPKKFHDSQVDDSFHESVMGFSSLQDVNLETYQVQAGDSISQVVMNKYQMSSDYLYKEYLDLVHKFNPHMKNLDLIYPDQIIRLPIYSSQIAKLPIEKPYQPAADKNMTFGQPESGSTAPSQKGPEILSLRRKLRDIFNQIGEEWVDSGEQFIPLKSMGHVKLMADSFPTVNVRNGRMLIIDLYHKLPEKIVRLIESDWQQYQVVRFAPHENLKAALDKLFAASGYYDVRCSGEKLKFRSDIDITLSGNWVLIPEKGSGDTPDTIIALNLISNSTEQTPAVVKTYLNKMGITVIDYPDFSSSEKEQNAASPQKITLEEDDRFPLTALLLRLAGQPFSRETKIPVYKNGETSFNLIVHADFLFARGGSDCIIDTTGLSADIVDLLTKHQFRVLTLADERDPHKRAELVLDFLDLEFDPKPHAFPVSAREESQNIILTVEGITFSDKDNRKILATHTTLPVEVSGFLSQKGYHLLELGQREG